MANLGNVKKTAEKCMNKAVSAANNAFEVSKRYAEKTQVNQKLTSMYERLGKAYYMQETGQKDESMLIKMLMNQISETNEELASAQQRFDKVRSKRCASCGKKNPAGSKFCIECGNKIEEK